ncbi:hypothetical protein GZH49_00555 [Nocardia terpenica]|uniref:hypothetical protein n=1 Tax=Nocardia terpenica TaxID=455432 RepID=UPI002FE2310A
MTRIIDGESWIRSILNTSKVIEPEPIDGNAWLRRVLVDSTSPTERESEVGNLTQLSSNHAPETTDGHVVDQSTDPRQGAE